MKGWPTHDLMTGIYQAPRSSPVSASTVIKSDYPPFMFDAHRSWLPPGWGKREKELCGRGIPNSEGACEAERWPHP